MTTSSPLPTDPAVAAPSAPVIRIAEALGYDPRALANSLPADTLRRTRYPAIQEVDAEGRTLWKHPEFREQE